jgi:hypothetical protein
MSTAHHLMMGENHRPGISIFGQYIIDNQIIVLIPHSLC